MGLSHERKVTVSPSSVRGERRETSFFSKSPMRLSSVAKFRVTLTFAVKGSARIVSRRKRAVLFIYLPTRK